MMSLALSLTLDNKFEFNLYTIWVHIFLKGDSQMFDDKQEEWPIPHSFFCIKRDIYISPVNYVDNILFTQSFQLFRLLTKYFISRFSPMNNEKY